MHAELRPMTRCAKALQLLEGGWVTKAYLAEQLGVSERAVKRILRAIEDGGFRLLVQDEIDQGVTQPRRYRRSR